jgi:hypothetical protein
MSARWVAFLGPSWPHPLPKLFKGCELRPPARQGDVFRALAEGFQAIALVDGVFEAVPSVWHHELLCALDAGVAVFGAASMGALRAAELADHGMVGVGEIFEWVREGRIVDDSEVALLHAGPEHRYQAFTVPLVNVRHAARRAVQRKALRAAEGETLVRVAEDIFYQERDWGRLLNAFASRAGAKARAGLEALRKAEDLDLKADDARACLEAVNRWVQGAVERRPAVGRPTSSLVRRVRLRGPVLDALRRHEGAAQWTRDGLMRGLLAGHARSLGVRVSRASLEATVEDWVDAMGGSLDEALRDAGMDAAELLAAVEEECLVREALMHAPRWVPDGPFEEEGLASEARLSGAWAEVARRMRRSRKPADFK